MRLFMILKLDFWEEVASYNQDKSRNGAEDEQVGCDSEMVRVDEGVPQAVNAVREGIYRDDNLE